MKSLTQMVIVACLVLGFHRQTSAADLPGPSPAKMCEDASLIVEGRWLEGQRVAITRLWKAPASLPKDIKELKVVGLAALTRTPRSPTGSPTKTIATINVMLFLTYDSKHQVWEPLYTFGDGSCGVFWLDETIYYGYVQLTNPGGYSLVAGGMGTQGSLRRLPATSQALRKSVGDGVAASERYQEDMGISDSGKRAQALVRYLLPRTTPDPSGAHLLQAGHAVGKLGKDAVPAIVAAIQAAPAKEEIHHLLTPLWAIGPGASAAKPVLLDVLARKDTNAGSVVVALETIGDPNCAPEIRPFLQSGDSTVRYVAARALAKLGDKQSFDAIAKLIPSPIKAMSIYEIKDLLNWLHGLDQARARPIAVRIGADPAMAPVRDQIEALKSR